VAAALAADHRAVLLVFALAWYLPVAALAAASPRRPFPLGPRWWLILASDVGALALVLALVHGSEPVVFMGAVLVAIVNGASFGARAGAVSGVVVGLGILLGHRVAGAVHAPMQLASHLGAFAAAVGVATYLVGRQAEDLRAARAQAELHAAELERVDRFRSRMISTLAHDVRTPLASVQGAAKTLLRLRGQLDPSEEEELLRGIERQATRLARLATGLLDLARLEEGRLVLDLREVDLRAAVLEALSSADPERRIGVQVEPGIRLLADPDRLDQVLVNLATNCLRHGQPPFVVSASREGGWVLVSFADAGPGVPPERRAELFQPFRRGDAGGSVGLGLWIVRLLVEAHGGTVTYEPNRPRGARFTVRLPVPMEHEGDRGARDAETASAGT
jgi:signal transduction histidine kinase